MQKEVILAVIFGSLLGIVVAFGIWKANSALNDNQQTTQTASEDQSLGFNQDSQESSNIIISKPQNLAVLQTDSVQIEGMTKPDSYICVINDDEISLSRANPKGGFALNSELSAGINNLNVFSVQSDQPAQRSELTLVYTTQYDGSEEDNKDSADETLDEKVTEKIDRVANAPTSYLGAITDITEGGFQIKSSIDAIKQISVDENTTYVNIVKTSNDIEFEELAIGDFIAALGTMAENEILAAKRVIVTTEPKNSSYLVHIGKLVSIDSNEVEISQEKGVDISFELSSGTRLRQFDPEDDSLTRNKIASFDEGDLVLLIAKNEDDGASLEGIFRLTVDSEE